MASRKGKKNETTLLVVFLLLLLLVGWLAWKWVSVSPAQPVQDNQPIAGAGPILPAPAQPSFALPSVAFVMPPDPVVPQPPPQVTTVEPLAVAPRATSPERTSPPATRSSTSRSAARGAATKSSASTSSAPALRAPTRPTRPSFSDSSVQGSPLDGYAIIKNKQQDTATGRYLLYCMGKEGSITYIYEVDAATFNEAHPGLQYNAVKVANWKFVSSQ